jgi:hypothetical protein
MSKIITGFPVLGGKYDDMVRPGHTGKVGVEYAIGILCQREHTKRVSFDISIIFSLFISLIYL